MFSAERNRITKAKAIRLHQTAFRRRLAFAFIGKHDDGRFCAAKPAANLFIKRHNPCARVDYEQRYVGTVNGGLGLRAHPSGERLRIILFKTSGINQPKFKAKQVRIALTPVTRDAGAIIDKRKLFANQPVEQRRFSDIGPSDNRDDGQRAHITAKRSGDRHR